MSRKGVLGRRQVLRACLALGILLSGLTGASPAGGNPQPKELSRSEFFSELDGASTVEFLTVEPGYYYSKRAADKNPLHKPSLMSFIILGTANLRGQEKQSLVNAFKAGIETKKDEKAAHCFNPRHGFRFSNAKGAEYQSVICYECSKIWAVRVDRSGTSKTLVMFTTPDPAQSFHKVAKQHHLEEAP